MKKVTALLVAPASLLLLLSTAACSGSSSDSGTLIQGTLTEAGGADHAARFLRHETGEHIDGVEICALGECSTTDAEGQWGFVVNTKNVDKALFTVKGHGINTTAVIEITPEADTITIALDHVAGGHIEPSSIKVDGVETHDHSDHDHAE